MANHKKYSLLVSQILFVVQNFVNERNEISLEFKKESNLFRFELSDLKEKKPGILLCYILKDGRCSFAVSGNPNISKICEQCRDDIISQTTIPNISQKTLTIKNVKCEDVESFFKLECEVNGYNHWDKETKNENLNFECVVKGDYGACVHLSHFKNGTLCLQGVLTEFYVIFSQSILQLVTDIEDDVIANSFEISNTAPKVVDEELSAHIENLTNISSSVISCFIKSSLVLMNSGICVGDYGCYTFGILKAIEALLIKRMQEDSPINGSFYSFFVKDKEGEYRFNKSIVTYDNNLCLKKALEDAYTFFHKHRHTTFHVDNMVEASRVLTFDDALDILKEGLKIINRICNNW